jgi:AraC-like DNA-binding protein
LTYIETLPSPDLAPYVHCVWELQDAGEKALVEPIFPDGRIEIVVHLADRPIVAGRDARQPDVMVVGQMTRAVRLQPVARLHALGIRFTPVGARAWLRVPQHQLTDAIHPLDELASTIAARIRAAAHDGRTPGERASRIEQVLRHTLGDGHGPPPAIAHAVRLTLARRGKVTINGLARVCGMSTRHLERHYLDAVGLTPKVLARTVRFQGALRDLQRGVPAVLAAHANGFADQSHLAREFRRFAGAAARDVNLSHVAFVQDSGAGSAAD